MPRKKIVPTESPKAAEAAAEKPVDESKSRKAVAKTASSTSRTRGKKAATTMAKLSEETAVSLDSTAILGSAVSEEEQIALLAYSYWEARGRQGGSPEEDWYRAVSEFRNRIQNVSKFQTE